MRCDRFGLTGVIAAGFVFSVNPLVGVTGAGAYDSSQSWNPFRTEQASYSSDLYDRQFVRRWEANPPRGYPTLSRANIKATKAAIARYKAIVADGGWSKVSDAKLHTGTSGQAVRLLHDRLVASGDLRNPSYHPSHFGYEMERALKRFQASNGLSPTGVTDRRTRAALRISAKVRLRQLRINLSRLRKHVKSSKARYVVVNIPAAQVEAVVGDRVVTRHAGVVGKIDRKTPLLSSRIHEINFNPVWRLPPTVIREDLIPKGRQMQRAKQDVLTKFGIDAYSGNRKLDPKKVNWNSSQPYKLSYRQQPGKSNPLGFAKINFHNAHAVYLHDTPSDRIFGRNFRAASSGCVRVENIESLLVWLLKSNGNWSKSAINRIKKSGDTKTVRLKKPVKLHMVYITAWATADGIVQFRRDLYRKDGVGKLAASY
ncbi:MAG: L,D-transpeptidase family protein [Pseudomonadota bacterium]